MDDLDRLFQRLVHNIRNGHAEYLSVPFTVQELYETLIPYRHYRRDLGIETNQDYEMAIARLISGERSYVRADQETQDRLRKELSSPHADPGVFRDYAASRISLVPEAVQQMGVAIPAQNAGGYSTGRAAPTADGKLTPPEGSTTLAIPAMDSMDLQGGCRFCGGTMPDGRPVIYCPHCGQNLAAKHCAGCGGEMEPSWKFCVNCGKLAA